MISFGGFWKDFISKKSDEVKKLYIYFNAGRRITASESATIDWHFPIAVSKFSG